MREGGRLCGQAVANRASRSPDRARATGGAPDQLLNCSVGSVLLDDQLSCYAFNGVSRGLYERRGIVPNTSGQREHPTPVGVPDASGHPPEGSRLRSSSKAVALATQLPRVPVVRDTRGPQTAAGTNSAAAVGIGTATVEASRSLFAAQERHRGQCRNAVAACAPPPIRYHARRRAHDARARVPVAKPLKSGTFYTSC